MVGNLLFAFLVSSLLIALPCSAEPNGPERTEQKVDFGDLHLSVMHNSGNGGYLLQFSRQGKVVYRGECAFNVRDPGIVSGIPLPSCRSLLAYCFSGGAHCCMSLIIASNCESKISLSLIDLAHSAHEVKFIDVKGRGEKALKATDWQFAYYGPEESDLMLSFADSPGMTRLLVFKDGKWRPDGIGEYGNFYNTLYREAVRLAKESARKGNDPELIAGKAIRAVYYGIMSGQSAEWASRELKRLLPRSWSGVSDRIAGDIRRAAEEFDPVRTIE